HLHPYRAIAESHTIQLDGGCLGALPTLDDDLRNPRSQLADASLDLLLEAYAVAHRFRVGERQLIAPQCSHQLTQVLFAQGDVIANLWRHLDLANLTELLERARPVLGLFELDASLECRTRF